MSKQNPAPKRVSVGGFEIGNDLPLALLAGPCQLESLDHAHMLAEKISATCADLGVPFVFKASYDKANRTSVSGKRGLGIEKGLEVLAAVREEFGCPVVTDVHDVEQVRRAGEVVDILQIPAFLCRQTDLLLAAGETGKVVNVKKGQFLAPWDMDHVAAKLASTGNEKIMLCERGTSFGYNALVSDMRSLPRMAETGYPVVFDATHSVQQPGGQGGSTGGDRSMVPVLARSAVAVGVAAIFMEVHDDPDNAPSDGPNMLRLEDLRDTLEQLTAFDRLTKSQFAA